MKHVKKKELSKFFIYIILVIAPIIADSIFMLLKKTQHINKAIAIGYGHLAYYNKKWTNNTKVQPEVKTTLNQISSMFSSLSNMYADLIVIAKEQAHFFKLAYQQNAQIGISKRWVQIFLNFK